MGLRVVFLSMWKFIKSLFAAIFSSGETRFLCDTCRYDYGNACRRPERPNATKCPDYKPGGKAN